MTFTESLESLPDFIAEMNPDWQMVHDYVTEQIEVEQLTGEQIVQVSKIYDDCMGYIEE